MNATEIQEALREIAWPITADGVLGPQTREAVSDFQEGWTFDRLVADGDPGPLTQAALQQCLERGGRCGEYFWFREFYRCLEQPFWPKVKNELVRALDVYRRHVGVPVGIVGGYRPETCNSRVGGASSSQHVKYRAADIPGVATLNEVIALGVFSGLGYVVGDELVVHVDVRHAGYNTTGGTPESPTIWCYGCPGVIRGQVPPEEPGEEAALFPERALRAP